MTFYQELQLNQAGSKALLKSCKTRKEKAYHLAVYIFKVLLTLAFCMAFVITYSLVFGSDNSVLGVVMLLCVLVFRNADLGMKMPDSIASFFIIFCIFAAGPRLANVAGPFGGMLINAVCLFALTFFGCHNVIMSNHSTLVLGYLLLYGYDTPGPEFLLRLEGLALGFVLTVLVYWHTHRNRKFKRTLSHLIREFHPLAQRSRWQLTLALAISTAMFIGNIFGLQRTMWIGIAAMSVTVPFRSDLKDRVRGRIPGNIFGCGLFLLLYIFLPESLRSNIGIIGGIGVGFSATYGWQQLFNALGGLTMAVTVLGVPGAIFYRILNNIIGSVYGLIFEKGMSRLLNRLTPRETAAEAD